MKPLLHTDTAKLLNGLRQRPSASYLFAGPEQVGKYTTALWLASELSEISDTLTLAPEAKPSIGVGAVAGLRHQLSLRNSTDGRQRLVIIDQADYLTTEAQNALLKTLEEPPESTTMVLVTANPDRLLTTVRSRLRAIYFVPPTPGQFEAWSNARLKDASIDRAMALEYASGSPGRLISYIENADLRERQAAVRTLSSQMIEPLSLASLLAAAGLATDPLLAQAVIRDLAVASSRQLRQARTEANTSAPARLEALERYQRRLAANVSPRNALEGLILELAC